MKKTNRFLQVFNNAVMSAAFMMQGEVLVKVFPAVTGKMMYVTKNMSSTRLRTGFFDIQTAVSRNNPYIMKYLPYKLADTCLDVVPKVKQVLIMGLGGGCFCHAVLKKHPDAGITAVDINPELPGLARKYFGLPDRVQTITAEAAEFMAINDRQYDMVFLDVFEGMRTPTSIVNERFFKDPSRAVMPEGIVIMNTIKTLKKSKEHEKISRLFKTTFRYSLQLRNWPGGLIPVNSEMVGASSITVFDRINKIVNDKKGLSGILPVMRVPMN